MTKRIIQVMQRPQLINELRHNLTFATDKEINRRILTKFRLHKFLTPCDPDNQAILQSIIDEWAEYFNEYYRVYSLRFSKDYKPLENYHRWEKLRNNHNDDTINDVNKLSGRTKTYDSGYESDADTLTQRVESETDPSHSSQNVKGTDNDDNEIWGNIGTMTAQQMEEQELALIKNVLDMYVSKFGEAFNLDMEVDIYGGYL